MRKEKAKKLPLAPDPKFNDKLIKNFLKNKNYQGNKLNQLFMKKTFLITIFSVILIVKLSAQTNKTDIGDTTKLNELIDNMSTKGDLVTQKNINAILAKYQYQLGGLSFKDGKTFGQNAVISDNALTMNLFKKPINNKSQK